MVFLPPRHSKSETVSRLFTAYYLHRYPERWVGLCSYAADLAYTLSRASRDHFREAGGQLRGDAEAVKHWETTSGGGLWAAGVGGPITGKGFHLGVIDDPLKNAEEAASEVIRLKQQEWYQSTFYTRQEPGAALVVIQTRWHEADLSGWLLSEEIEGESPERWHIVNLPAIAEDRSAAFPTTCTAEGDWRETGEALCPERYPLPKLEQLRQRIGSYYWAALYQQRPAPREGGFFKRAWFEIMDAAPVTARQVRCWDLAATEGAGDWTVGVRMSRTEEGLFFVDDVVRGRWGPGDRDNVIVQTARLDGVRVRQQIEQEPGSGGKSQAFSLSKKLAGYPVSAEPSTGDKTVRADPFAAQCQAGNVRLVKGAWVREYLEELCSFPTGTHDDQVDASSGAFHKLLSGKRYAIL